MQNLRLNEAINKLDVLVFLKDFSIEEEVTRITRDSPGLAPGDAERLLRLVRSVRNSDKEFRIGPVPHPLGKHKDFAKVPTFELSEKCFRLQKWADCLCRQFPEVEPEIVNRVIRRYVYLRHLR